MNIKITHNWLKEYLETDATPDQIQKYLSLCGPSVESVIKNKDDYIYDIEVTSNRIDTASVVGIAREAFAILNQYGIKAQLKNVIVPEPKNDSDRLSLSISDTKKLCNRVVSVVMDNVHIKDSPKYIKDRLESVGIRSLNNIIDITNYVMIEYGHPTHVMDYDRIKTGKLIIRNAEKGESAITLDGKKHQLSKQDVIADDGTGRIVDLLGIMGTENSVVTTQTKRVVLFIESNNPHIIRHTSMKLGIRTVAAIYDEKQVDSELAKVALNRLIQLFEELAEAKIASKSIDIYNRPTQKKSVSISMGDLDRIIGVPMKKDEVVTILKNLGFNFISDKNNLLTFSIPSFRSHDISIKEDLVEEVARIYGYHHLPSALQPMVYIKQPKESELIFSGQSKIKYFLKHLGLHEVMNYSMISKEMIESYDFDPKEYLRLSNTISEEIEYMRRTLLYSLVKNIKDNEGKKEEFRFFEIAKTYLSRENELPDETFKLGIAVNTSFSDLKGILDALFKELNIESIKTKITEEHTILNKKLQGEIYVGNHLICVFGQLNKKYEFKQQLTKPVYLAQLGLEALLKSARQFPRYRPINQFATVKLDFTIEMDGKTNFEEIKIKAFKVSSLLENVEVVSIYKNRLSLRFYFSSSEKNITEDEAKKDLKKISDSVS